MASCRICLEDAKKPVALPCGMFFSGMDLKSPHKLQKGHIFCNGCIVKTVQAVKPYTHLQPCPICRAIYNIGKSSQPKDKDICFLSPKHSAHQPKRGSRKPATIRYP